MFLCPQMEEIKVSPAYNWFRSTVPLKRVSTIVLTEILYKYTLESSRSVNADNAGDTEATCV